MVKPKIVFNIVVSMKDSKIRAEIDAYLEKEERSLMWLADKCDINYNTFYFVMNNKEARFSLKVLSKINQFLGTSYTND